MRRILPIFLALLCCALLCAGTAPAGQRPLIAFGELFPEIALPAPVQPAARDYLGLPAGDSFTLSQLKGELVLVELFNVHCMNCQKQAGPYNRLFELIENNPETRGRIKLLAFAAGNLPEEVDEFKAAYQVRFPVLPDPHFEVYRALGGQATPFSLFVRQSRPGQPGVVGGTHLGLQENDQELYAELRRLAGADPDQLRRQGEAAEKVRTAIAPMLSPEELEYRVRSAFINTGGLLADFAPLDLPSGRRVYLAQMRQGEEGRRLFAEVTSRSSACISCKNIHFIYVFTPSGKVVGFEPLQLSKGHNKPWSPGDIEKVRRRLLGSSLTARIPFDPKLDAVTSATISSAVIFDSLAQGEKLLRELRGKGLLEGP